MCYLRKKCNTAFVPIAFGVSELATELIAADLDLTPYKGWPSVKHTDHGVYGLVLKCLFIA